MDLKFKINPAGQNLCYDPKTGIRCPQLMLADRSVSLHFLNDHNHCRLFGKLENKYTPIEYLHEQVEQHRNEDGDITTEGEEVTKIVCEFRGVLREVACIRQEAVSNA
jgi:hypothetical protein